MPAGLFSLPAAPEPGQPIRSPFLKELALGVGRANNVEMPNGMITAAGTYFAGEQGPATPLWLNLASSLCPAFGIVRRTGSHADSSRGIPLFTGAQSNTFGSQYSHILNGEFDVNEGEWGEVQTGEYLIARYRPADGAPAIGDRVGPRNGSWEMRLNTGGFVVEELIDTTTDFLIRVRRAPMLDFYGKNAGSQISRGSTGTINIYAGVYTSEADTGETMTGVLAKFGAIAAGAKVQCRLPDTANGTTAAIGWFAYETDTCPT